MKTGFIDKLIERLGRVSPEQVQDYLMRFVKEKGFLERVFQAMQEGVIVTDNEGMILYLNAAACHLFGWSEEEALGDSLESRVRGLHWQALARAKGVVSRDLEVFYPENRYLNFYLAPVEENEGRNDTPGYLMLVRDITQNRKLTEEMIESERLSALTLLAAGVAHELGNPLNSLTIHLQLLGRRLQKSAPEAWEDVSPLLETAKNEIQRLDFIIEQFLGAVRPSQPRLEMCDPNQLIREALQVLKAELSDREVTVELDLHAQLPHMEVDPGQIKQALYNVLRNASQALRGNGGRLRVRSDFDDYGITLSVEDNGTGISASEMARVFEPYRTTRKSGHGLGLLIVRRILREHGGEIHIESGEGKGTTVSMCLPFASPRVRLLEPPKDKRNASGKRKIIDMEDEE